LIDALFIVVNSITLKVALHLTGRIENEYRLPLCKRSHSNFVKLKKAMAYYGLIKE
jgi:4-hydroxy-tetrahydrodipicolinate synthase